MKDSEKLQKIAEIIGTKDNTTEVLENAAKSIKELLNFEVEFTKDGKIKRYWYKEKPTRKKKV